MPLDDGPALPDAHDVHRDAAEHRLDETFGATPDLERPARDGRRWTERIDGDVEPTHRDRPAS